MRLISFTAGAFSVGSKGPSTASAADHRRNEGGVDVIEVGFQHLTRLRRPQLEVRADACAHLLRGLFLGRHVVRVSWFRGPQFKVRHGWSPLSLVPSYSAYAFMAHTSIRRREIIGIGAMQPWHIQPAPGIGGFSSDPGANTGSSGGAG